MFSTYFDHRLQCLILQQGFFLIDLHAVAYSYGISDNRAKLECLLSLILPWPSPLSLTSPFKLSILLLLWSPCQCTSRICLVLRLDTVKDSALKASLKSRTLTNQSARLLTRFTSQFFSSLAQSREEPNRPLEWKASVQMVDGLFYVHRCRDHNITSDLVDRTKDEIL